jgi:hypothetical protein
MVLRRRVFSPPRNILSVRFSAEKRAQTLISPVPDKRFQAQTDRFRVGSRSASGLSLLEQLLVDVERLFHMYDYAIQVW